METKTTSSPQHALIVGPAWIGDMVMANSMFQLLKQQGFEQLTVISPGWCLPLLQRMPEVDQTLELNIAHGKFAFRTRLHFGRQLCASGFSQAFVLPNSWKSALVPAAARIPIRTGWLGEKRYGLLTDWRKLDKGRYPRMVDRFNALAYPANSTLPAAPTPHLISLQEQQKQTVSTLNLERILNKKFIALCPGAAFGSAKQWGIAGYSQLAKLLLDENYLIGLMGSKQESAITKKIIEQLPKKHQANCIDFAGKTSLNAAIDLLALADSIVTNDSGLMHIAAALKRPVVAIYGPTSTQFTPPLTDQATVLQTDLA